MAIDRVKFKQMVHYICWKCDNPQTLGATKLNKIIWFAERTAFLRMGKSMTGVRFVKQERGPVPNAILPILRELEAERALAVRDTRSISYLKKEYIALRDPDFDAFTSREVSLLDAVIEAVCKNHTAGSISKLSHDEVWDMAKIGEEIPLTAILGIRGEIQEEDIQRAKNIIPLSTNVEFVHRNQVRSAPVH